MVDRSSKVQFHSTEGDELSFQNGKLLRGREYGDHSSTQGGIRSESSGNWRRGDAPGRGCTTASGDCRSSSRGDGGGTEMRNSSSSRCCTCGGDLRSGSPCGGSTNGKAKIRRKFSRTGTERTFPTVSRNEAEPVIAEFPRQKVVYVAKSRMERVNLGYDFETVCIIGLLNRI